MSTMTPPQEADVDLNRLTEQAYQVFGKYRIKRLMDVCTVCCINKEEQERLLSVAPYGLSCEDLSLYATAAFASQPAYPDEFKHFLPRYLELLKDFDSPAITETTFDRLKKYRAIEEWSDDELQLLHDFSGAFFAKLLSSYPPRYPFTWLDNALIMFDNGGIDINPLLVQWRDSEDHSALLHLKDLLLQCLSPKKNYQLDNGFASAELSATVKQWLVDNCDVFCDRIEHCIADTDFQDEYTLDELSWAYERLIYHFHPAEDT